jgi:hypothetical protein
MTWRRGCDHLPLMAAPLLVLAWAGCAADAASEPVQSSKAELQGTLDPRRSLAVTDQAILARFPLQRVLDQLVSQSRVRGLTSLKLFQQWWDIMNPSPGLGQGPHCNDQTDPQLGNVLNGFPYACRPTPSEGSQAGCDPFAANSPCAYVPIGLFNRFDLMPENGEYCGEYRVIYAKASGIEATDDRNLIIFEAALPNPVPLLGIEGCRPIIEAWANLSDIADPNQRAARLEQLYFQGILVAVPPIPPIISADNFGNNAAGRGQVRTNQFVHADPRIWSLREFKLKRSCGLLGCSWMRFEPATDKGNPAGTLFDALSAHPKRAAFQAFLPAQVPTLSKGTLPEIAAEIPDTYDSGLSEASGTTETNYASNFGTEPNAFRSALAAALAQAGSSLTPDNIVARVQGLSCAGCHRLSNGADLGGGLTWPASLGFTHVTERETEPADVGVRYKISDALTSSFLPHRAELLQQYLDKTLVVRLLTPLRPIGGFLVH